MKIPGLAVPLLLAGVATTVLLVTACGPDRGGEGWAGQVDTLSTGVVVVRSPQEPLWDPAAAWTVVETRRIGSLEGDGPDVFGSIGGFVVDREERIWIVDRQTYDLRIFARDGSHLRTVGRRGGGPGEFGDPIGVTLAPDGRVWVVDPGNARFSIHGLDGDFEESRPRPVGGYAVPWRGGFDEDGRFWEASVVPRTGGPRGAILRFGAELQPLDTLLLPQRAGGWSFELHLEGGGMMSAAVPFSPATLWARSPGGTVWVAGDGAYRLHRLTEDGDTARTVERAFTSVPVSTEEREEAIEGLGWFVRQGGRIDPSRIPREKPALRDFALDREERLWVVPHESLDAEGTRLDVFDPEGRFLGPVRLPGRIPYLALHQFVGEALYVVDVDGLGVQSIVRYDLRRP